ncbi:hypothetical protein [Agrobacterium rosae]|uniref:hypothetical protein n=1 Tax=Agrobacterium rosae TaxID=1972867 RepID=UPI003A7FF70F
MTVKPDDRQRQPFDDVTKIPYDATFSAEDYDRIQSGFSPAGMEDKWFIYFSESSLFLHRSWTGKGVYRVDFEPDQNGAKVCQAVCDAEIVAKSTTAYQAQLLGFLISNILLDKEETFPLPAGLVEPSPGVYQHHVSGTGYRQIKTKGKQPWWKFWISRH